MEQRQALIEALDLIKVMGNIIRRFDESGDYSEYWLNDGDYVPAATEIAKGLDDQEETVTTVEKTEDNYEKYLNDVLYDETTWSQIKDRYIYLTNRYRGNSITYEQLHSRYISKQMGTTLRELDSVGFTVGFNDWNP